MYWTKAFIMQFLSGPIFYFCSTSKTNINCPSFHLNWFKQTALPILVSYITDSPYFTFTISSKDLKLSFGFAYIAVFSLSFLTSLNKSSNGVYTNVICGCLIKLVWFLVNFDLCGISNWMEKIFRTYRNYI